MKGYVFNPDKEFVNKILNGIYKRDGHCPCRVYEDETTLCPCDDFINNGTCKCNLYVKEDEIVK